MNVTILKQEGNWYYKERFICFVLKMHFGTQLKAEYVDKMGIFASSAGLKAQDGEMSHHRTVGLVSTTFTHPDNWWGNHLHKAHPVGVYTHVNHCLITDLLIVLNMFI